MKVTVITGLKNPPEILNDAYALVTVNGAVQVKRCGTHEQIAFYRPDEWLEMSTDKYVA